MHACASSAASMVCCHVFVELGMTKPNWKCHSGDKNDAMSGKARKQGLLASEHSQTTSLSVRHSFDPTTARLDSRTFYATTLKKDSLFQPKIFQHLHS